MRFAFQSLPHFCRTGAQVCASTSLVFDRVVCTKHGNQNAPGSIADAKHDILAALDAWVETDTPPDRIVASRIASGAVVRTRPHRPDRSKARYTGKGSTDAAANFVCP